MRGKLKELYRRSTFAMKIRYSYMLLLLPLVGCLLFSFYNLWIANRSYEDMVRSVAVASQFSLDFKKDFDYETYLLIVGNKTVEDSELDNLLGEANRVVSELQDLTDAASSKKRLSEMTKYLSNLTSYKERIEENLEKGDRYEDNIEIWENDVQIVTALLKDAVIEYFYYEVRDLQATHNSYRTFFVSMFRYSLLAFLLIIIMVIFLSYYIPQSITSPIRELGKVTDQVAKGDLSVRSKVDTGVEVSALSDSLNVMIDKINELLQQVTEEQTGLRKAEFQVLQSQINPHFLYNTLDAIVWLAESGQQKQVVSMVGSLSEFFRSSLNQGKDIVTIREELQHVRSYLEIQQVRYQDILKYEIDIPETLYEYRIPKISIQPLVENALYHGVKNKRGCGTIRITGSEDHNIMMIQVTDDGMGMTPERLAEVRKGLSGGQPEGTNIYGLYNVNERIRLHFGKGYGLTIESERTVGTKATIYLPCVKTEVKNSN